MWTTTDGVYVRIDSTTYPLAIVADGPGGLSADNVTSGILAGQYGGTGVNNSGKTITLGGNLTTSGAYGLTLTLTGATNVTLPTSGTLVNSAVTTLSSLVSVGTVTTGTWNASVVAGQYGGTGVANTGKTITVSGNTTIGSSTNTVAFVTSGNTSVTLPTSGTLATLGSPTFTGTVTAPTFTASTSLNLAAVADTATTATHYYVETATDGLVRPKTLANVKTEIVTTAAVNSAAATTVGTVTSGTWQGTAINATYIDSAIARLASPTFTGTTTTTGVEVAYSAKTANYTLTSTDYVVDATANSFTFTLPASTEGRKYVLKNSGTGTITVDTTSSQTIDGELTFNLGQHESITVVSDGSNWVII
jgi:hypothetical protein